MGSRSSKPAAEPPSEAPADASTKSGLKDAIAHAKTLAKTYNQIATLQKKADAAAANFVKVGAGIEEQQEDSDYDSEEEEDEKVISERGAKYTSKQDKLKAELEQAKQESRAAKKLFRGMCRVFTCRFYGLVSIV